MDDVRRADQLLEQVVGVAARLGVRPEEVVEVTGGVANRGFGLGDRMFVRVARAGFEADLRKEIAVIPVARAAGVLTPGIVEYDESREVIDAPYVVMGRVHGIEPTDVPAELAEQLARLHDGAGLAVPGLPQDDWRDPWPVIDDLAERGFLDLGTAKWLADWFSRLAERFDRDQPTVLIHGDVAAHNLLVTPDGELTGLIDWGDAAYAPRAVDFAKLPLEHVAAILPDYVRHSTAGLRLDELAAGAVWLHLDWALGKLPAAPWPGQRHWTAPPASRILGLLRFFAGNPPEPWSGLT
ncbi:aminoglycoside phosphotransferase family protein [Kribbella sp. NPDC051952]|uniref:aminoglycoside phosphotransferase family protein n=1 Tax=Kribbella sp. NPDC051952 TaxID=3154851 RepID=UPI00343871D6